MASENVHVEQEPTDPMVAHTTAIVVAYVSHNGTPAAELPHLLRSVYGALFGLGGSGAANPITSQKPAVPVKRSITPDYLICLEDGAKLKMLKRYLRTRYKLSPEEYRAKWSLPHDYPMVAPKYSARRSQFAKESGLGKLPAGRKQKKRS